MSWSAWLIDDRGHEEGEWNYTHNCNGMARLALEGPEDPPPLYTQRGSWWRALDGMTGAEGAEFLSRIIKAMESDPPKYQALNPPNGWGDYDRFLGVLREMHKASLVEWPTVWSVHG